MASETSLVQISPSRVGVNVSSTRPLVKISVGTSVGNTTVTAANIGTGIGVYANKVGGEFQFKSFTVGSNIVLTESADEINIDTTGLVNPATDFNSGVITGNTVVDHFAYTSATSARWDVQVVGTGQRSGEIFATWTSDGLSVDYSVFGFTPDVGGATSDVTFDVNISGTDVQLVANIAAGSWTISGSRYYIPTNGLGSGPVSSFLTHNKIYIGDTSNSATEQSVSGAITISDTGVTTLANSIVSDANIASSAAIALSKLATVSPSRVLVSSASGYVSASSISTTKLGYLTDVTSNIQAQFTGKLGTSLAQGSIFIGNASSVATALPIGTANYVLTSTGTTASWQASTSIPVTYTTSGGTTSSIAWNIKVIEIGSWNMDTTLNVDISHGLDPTKIRSVKVIIQKDSGDSAYPLDTAYNGVGSSTDPIYPQGTIEFLGVSYPAGAYASKIRLRRLYGGIFDNTNYSSTAVNRGWVTIEYQS